MSEKSQVSPMRQPAEAPSTVEGKGVKNRAVAVWGETKGELVWR